MGELDNYDLTPKQLYALLDILTHHEAYREIESFKISTSIRTFGQPFGLDTADQDASSPLIQLLLKKFILILPGLRDVDASFWREGIPKLAIALADANLSESYDKGSIGIRRTLSTAVASLAEAVSRGMLGGFTACKGLIRPSSDPGAFEDLEAAWTDFLHQSLHGDMLDRLFARASQTDQLSQHEPCVQKAHEYVLIMLASFVHYTLIISPRGQSMLPLLTRANDMLPYFMIRQTLKMGNAASMLNGMVKIVLAKMNMGTFTSWLGGASSDSGMNLLQYIISTVLGWDNNILKKRASAIEQSTNSPSKAELRALREYCMKPRIEQLAIRQHSEQEPCSIISAILSASDIPLQLSQQAHTEGLDYLSIQLSIRDRQELINVLCQHQPDLLTSSVRTLVSAYEPIIRSLHKAVDLSSGVSDMQSFLTDLIQISRMDGKVERASPPGVEDFLKLMRAHAPSSHRFIHQVLQNGPELSQWYRDYTGSAMSQYKSRDDVTSIEGAAGDLSDDLHSLFKRLGMEERRVVIGELDAHAEILSRQAAKSRKAFQDITVNEQQDKSGTLMGPGEYLFKWERLINASTVTPESPRGEVRVAASPSVKMANKVDTDGTKKGDAVDLDGRHLWSEGLPPSSPGTVKLLGPGFQALLQQVTTGNRDQ